jgi:hypothetical protein
MARWNLRRRQLFAHLEIANTHKLSRATRALSPNISIDVLGDANYQSQRLVIRYRKGKEVTVFEQV